MNPELQQYINQLETQCYNIIGETVASLSNNYGTGRIPQSVIKDVHALEDWRDKYYEDCKESDDNALRHIKVFEDMFDGANSNIPMQGTNIISPNQVMIGDSFDNWLPLVLGWKTELLENEGLLKLVRDTARIVTRQDGIARNVQRHLVNNIVGEEFTPSLELGDEASDPQEQSEGKADPEIKGLMDNWRKFAVVNNMCSKFREWVKRAHRDGESILLIKPGKAVTAKPEQPKVPKVTFLDPWYVTGVSNNIKDIPDPMTNFCGVVTAQNDAADILALHYRQPDTSKFIDIPIESVIFDKRNVDENVRRGVSSYYSIFPNLRRLQKLLVNLSTLAQIQSAITLVRKHAQASAPQLTAFVRQRVASTNRTDAVTGVQALAQQFKPGAIIDTNTASDYVFPAHSSDASKFAELIDCEKSIIAAAFQLPVEWIMASEPQTPLSEGSPCMKMFKAEQAELSVGATKLFWAVQKLMGIEDTDELQLKYQVTWSATRIAVGSSVDQSRSDEMDLRNGIVSPQTLSKERGRNYKHERSNLHAHAKQLAPGESMPGQIGSTNNDTSNEGGKKRADGGHSDSDRAPQASSREK
jgi:hypothetical protein